MKKVIIPTEFTNEIIGRNEIMDGERVELLFENGYGASVINHRGSYGLELAVLCNREITYNTPLTDDVIMNLDAESLKETLSSIKSL